MVCLEGKLEMVYGVCQHRVCAECLYNENRYIRPSMKKCPMCFLPHSFPNCKPDIPEDNVQQQRLLGVRACPNKGCKFESWQWEMEDHLLKCAHGIEDFKSNTCSNIKVKPGRSNSVTVTRSRGRKRKSVQNSKTGSIVS